MTLLAAGLAAKGLLILIMSISVAAGLSHSKLIQMLTRRAIFRDRLGCMMELCFPLLQIVSFKLVKLMANDR